MDNIKWFGDTFCRGDLASLRQTRNIPSRGRDYGPFSPENLGRARSAYQSSRLDDMGTPVVYVTAVDWDGRRAGEPFGRWAQRAGRRWRRQGRGGLAMCGIVFVVAYVAD